jgi:hypothetical protein
MGLVVVGTTGVSMVEPPVPRGGVVVLPHGFLAVVFRVGTRCPHPAKSIMRMRMMVMMPTLRMEIIKEYLINHIFMPLSHKIPART